MKKAAPVENGTAFQSLNRASTAILASLAETAVLCNSNSSDPLAGDGILIARFWKSARNRRAHIQLALKSYEGHPYLDCRLFAANAAGQSVPTPKGLTVGVKQLPEFLRSVDKAYCMARDLGLIAGASS